MSEYCLPRQQGLCRRGGTQGREVGGDPGLSAGPDAVAPGRWGGCLTGGSRGAESGGVEGHYMLAWSMKPPGARDAGGPESVKSTEETVPGTVTRMQPCWPLDSRHPASRASGELAGAVANPQLEDGAAASGRCHGATTDPVSPGTRRRASSSSLLSSEDTKTLGMELGPRSGRQVLGSKATAGGRSSQHPSGSLSTLLISVTHVAW